MEEAEYGLRQLHGGWYIQIAVPLSKHACLMRSTQHACRHHTALSSSSQEIWHAITNMVHSCLRTSLPLSTFIVVLLRHECTDRNIRVHTQHQKASIAEPHASRACTEQRSRYLVSGAQTDRLYKTSLDGPPSTCTPCIWLTPPSMHPPRG